MTPDIKEAREIAERFVIWADENSCTAFNQYKLSKALLFLLKGDVVVVPREELLKTIRRLDSGFIAYAISKIKTMIAATEQKK